MSNEDWKNWNEPAATSAVVVWTNQNGGLRMATHAGDWWYLTASSYARTWPELLDHIAASSDGTPPRIVPLTEPEPEPVAPWWQVDRIEDGHVVSWATRAKPCSIVWGRTSDLADWRARWDRHAVPTSWRVTDAFTLRTSAGKAFHAPTVYDLYRSSFSSYLISANPALTPETVKSWEMGGDWRAWNGGEIRTTYFYNEIDDLIYLGPKQTGPGNIVVRKRINAGKARTDGVTLSATHHFDADNRIFANLTYTHSEMLENSASPSSVGKQLTGLPKKQASVGFETRRGDWRLSTSGRYAGKQYSDDTNTDTAVAVYRAYDAYFVVDSKLSYRFSQSLNASLAVSNLFDRNYFSYYAAPGRAWFASLAYSY